jgi:thioredoxin-related protein
MLRRFLLILIRRSQLILLLICLGCVAQSAPPDVARKIEHQVRSFYTIPADVKVTVGAVTPSTDVPGYDALTVNIDGGDGKQKDYKFLLSKDRATLLRVTKFDLNKDPFAELMSKIDVAGRPSRGAKSAKVVVINFDDFECPFCSRMHQTLFPEIFKE